MPEIIAKNLPASITGTAVESKNCLDVNVAAGGGSTTSTTGTVTSVNDTASSTTLLALNTSRLGASFFNDSTEILYLKCGATASTTSFTAKVGVGQYYELPFNYTGIIDGIWAANAAGAVRVTEFT